jgi:hypothetical protein
LGAKDAVGLTRMSDFPQTVWVSAVTMGIAHTITRERLFEPVRRWTNEKSAWLGYLLSCPYCASHYVAFALVALTGTMPIEVPRAWGFVTVLLRWFLSSILVTVIAAFLRVGFYFVDETQGLLRREQRKVDVEVRKTIEDELTGPDSGRRDIRRAPGE